MLTSMKHTQTRPRIVSFSSEIASLIPKKEIFFDKPVLLGADRAPLDWKEVKLETRNAGKFVVGAYNTDSRNRVRLYGILWASRNPDPSEMELIGHRDILPILARLGKIKDVDVLVLGGGVLCMVHEPPEARSMMAGGSSDEFGRVPTTLMQETLLPFIHENVTNGKGGYSLEVRGYDVANPMSAEARDWYLSAHMFVEK